MIPGKLLRALRVEPGEKAKLKKRETGWAFTDELKVAGKDVLKQRAREILDENLAELAAAQELLYASGTHAVLIVLQALDAGGKDGTIKHVMSGVNPQGCRVDSFKQPSAEERSHDFLWRYAQRVPGRGLIGIFNRSYYEEVLVLRVHPELLSVPEVPGKAFWKDRFKAINAFERHLTRCNTVILKFFLHISKDEQRRRLLERLDDPEKHWKFSPSDLHERGFWDDYVDAYEAALTATSTAEAPWFVVPADYKWVARTVVAAVVTSTIQNLGLRWPEVSPEQRAALDGARRQLSAE